MKEHNAKQLRAKRRAIDIAIVELMQAYKNNVSEDLLFHNIESLNQLVLEYKRG